MNAEDVKNKLIHNCNKFTGYRIADCFLCNTWDRWGLNKETGLFNEINQKTRIPLGKFTYEKWPDSIAGQYSYRNNFKKNQDLNLLLDIILEKYPNTHEKNITSVHLRIGDVLAQKQEAHTSRFLDPSFYSKQEFNNNTNEIFIVFGIHYNCLIDESLDYVENVKKHIEKKTNKNCKIRSTTPDEDFVFMLFSKYFIPSKSGLCKVINRLKPLLENK